MIFKIIILCLLTVGASATELIESTASPQDETTIFGEAAQPNGTFNEFMLEQPQNANNPLGNPIYYTPSGTPEIFAPQAPTPPAPQTTPATNGVSEISPQNPSFSQMSPQTVGNEIQNKLYQSGNRIYDVQSYPAKDIGYINQNNQNNAITNYPAY
ncbi:MAG: hypothetical protein J6Y53_04980 [Alphaproteobacteria bacterium]|nr:hypothetical protein [Alphaproteobacteria bacterium]